MTSWINSEYSSWNSKQVYQVKLLIIQKKNQPQGLVLCFHMQSSGCPNNWSQRFQTIRFSTSPTVWLYYHEATQFSLLVIPCNILKGFETESPKKNTKTYIPQELYNSLGSNLDTEWFHRLIIKWHVSHLHSPPNSGTVQRRSRLTLPQLNGEALSGRRLGNPVGRMSRRGLLPFGGGSNPCRMA